MITHGVDEFMDDLRRTWCGIDLAPMVPRSTDDAVVDCMTCLVREARRRTVTDIVGRVVSINPNGTALIDLETTIVGRVVSINPNGTALIDLETTGVRPWR